MDYNSRFNKILTIYTSIIWFVFTIGMTISTNINFLKISSIIQIILIIIKNIIVNYINPNIIKTRNRLIIPSILIITVSLTLFILNINDYKKEFEEVYQDIIFWISYAIWILGNIVNLIYDIKFIYDTDYRFRLP
jgi:hypothetical protein